MADALNAIERKEITKLAETCGYKSTHFNRQETEKLLYEYRRMTSKTLDRSTFRDLLHGTFGMTDDFFMDRVFRAFDKDNDSYLSPKEWVQGMSVLLRGTLDEKMEFCFSIYDLKNTGLVTREEMFHLLKTTMIKHPTEEDPEEGIKDLVEFVLKKMDVNGDGRVCVSDFKTTVMATPLLLEAFGRCLPEGQCIDKYAKAVFDA